MSDGGGPGGLIWDPNHREVSGDMLLPANHLMGPQFPLVKYLEDLVVNIDDNFSPFLGQMATIH